MQEAGMVVVLPGKVIRKVSTQSRSVNKGNHGQKGSVTTRLEPLILKDRLASQWLRVCLRHVQDYHTIFAAYFSKQEQHSLSKVNIQVGTWECKQVLLFFTNNAFLDFPLFIFWLLRKLQTHII